MSTICVAAPPQWAPVVAALSGAGHEVCALLGSRTSPNMAGPVGQIKPELAAFEGMLDASGSAALIDLQKTGRATGMLDVVVQQIGAFGMNLTTAYGVRRFVEEAVRQRGATAVVVTCTYDVPGRAVLAGAAAVGIPVVHLQHACAADPPEACWFAREAPGDVVLVPGERDRDWWRRCNPDARVVVTGHPLWDHYHATPQPVLPDKPVIVWGDQSPTNQEQQTEAYWQSRDVPERAWQAFLAWLERANGLGGVVFKGRGDEAPGYTEARWQALAKVCAWRGIECRYADGSPSEVFALGISLVVCQDSNLGVEALHLGIPVVSITRPGSTLFDHHGSIDAAICVDGTRPNLFERLGDAIESYLTGIRDGSCDLVLLDEQAIHYNRGATDGQAMARVVAAIGDVAAGRLVK